VAAVISELSSLKMRPYDVIVNEVRFVVGSSLDQKFKILRLFQECMKQAGQAAIFRESLFNGNGNLMIVCRYDEDEKAYYLDTHTGKKMSVSPSPESSENRGWQVVDAPASSSAAAPAAMETSSSNNSSPQLPLQIAIPLKKRPAKQFLTDFEFPDLSDEPAAKKPVPNDSK